MTEWFSEQQAVYIGSFGGAGIGVLGGLMGTAAGVLAPRGKAKGLVLGLHSALLALGLLVLVAGVAGIALGQPRHVWYPLVLGGGILTVVLGSVFPIVRMRYRQVEQRKMQAQELRQG